ncbi:hypothetical protein J6TS2_39400 [Heyndrickxia sporothermodurans]|nr:hypothetical protein J6TS2_39400 [Heyndrickxia sporothermodurans]
MYKNILLLLLLFSILICGTNKGTVYAKKSNHQLEEIYLKIGYTTIEKAVRDFEQHFNQDLKLPFRVPPLNFTHHFGRFNDLDGDINDSFEMEFLNDNLPENHYKIDIRPIKHGIPIRGKNVSKLFKLKNGNDATYMDISGFNVLVFERDNWQYVLSIDNRVCNKITPKTLVQIADSIGS